MSALLKIHASTEFLSIGDVMAKHEIKQVSLVRQLCADGMPCSKGTVRALMQGLWPKKYSQQAVKKSILRLFNGRLTGEEANIMFDKAAEQNSEPQTFKASFLLVKYNFSQVDANKVLKEAGINVSPATLNMFLNNGYTTNKYTLEDFQQPLEAWLAKFATKEEIKTMWQTTAREHKGTTRKNILKNNFVESMEPEMLTQKAMKHFRVSQHPFADEMRGMGDLYLSHHHLRVREAMIQAAQNSSILAVSAECGAGKTTLRECFNEYTKTEMPNLVIIEPEVTDKKLLTAAMIFEAIADELGIVNLKMGHEKRSRQIKRELIKSVKNGNSHVLVIEEAHDLSNAVLKHLKRVHELREGFRSLLGIILVGQTELNKNLQNYDVREFSLRCNVVDLPPLGLGITDYVAHKFSRKGVDHTKVIDQGGIDAIKERLQGSTSFGLKRSQETKDMSYPLNVNTMLVKAMNLACSMSEPLITKLVIKEIK